MDYAIDINCYDSKITEIDFNTPVNKKEIPCDGCEYENTCALKVLECSAFRNWASTGNYKKTDVIRFLRAAQMTSFVTAGYTSEGQRVVLWRLGDYTYEIQGALKALENNSKESTFLLDTSYEMAMKKFKEYTK